jgi:hypothetical protein
MEEDKREEWAYEANLPRLVESQGGRSEFLPSLELHLEDAVQQGVVEDDSPVAVEVFR